MQAHIRTGRLERKRRQLRQAMRELKGWGDLADAGCERLLECYRYTREDDPAEYLLRRAAR